MEKFISQKEQEVVDPTLVELAELCGIKVHKGSTTNELLRLLEKVDPQLLDEIQYSDGWIAKHKINENS